MIDRIYTECPFYGSRKIMADLRDIGIRIGRKRCRRLMKAMGIEGRWYRNLLDKDRPTGESICRSQKSAVQKTP